MFDVGSKQKMTDIDNKCRKCIELSWDYVEK